MKIEKNWEFRKRMLCIHEKNIRDYKITADEGSLELKNGFIIDLSATDSEVILTAAKDFQDFMLTSMNVSGMISNMGAEDGNCIRIRIDKTLLDEGKGYMGYKLCVDEEISVIAFDERGAAQALYYIEEQMKFLRAPILKKETVERKALFTPRMVHSGYGLDQFPDAHLSAIAHDGFDAILVFVNGVHMTPYGYLDFNELIYRASKFGIDVYAYSYMKSEKHPDDDGAETFYEGTYGKLFRECPGLKGVILVGESVGFPSKDPHTLGRIDIKTKDGIPDKRVHPGWWPCYDYPQWLNMLKKVIRKYNSEADIVFWTYNWGWAPEEDRLNLIKSLPEDISLLVTFDRPMAIEREGVKTRLDDYSIVSAEPSKVFLSEAKAAKERGLRLYSMTNTAGLTWDFGVIPYEPFPYQWQKRHDAILECREKYGLCGLMESHHYGFYPSIISEIAKLNFTYSTKPSGNAIKEVLARSFGEKNTDVIDRALKLWSDAIALSVPSKAEQYGPMRTGPSYPFCFATQSKPTAAEFAHFGTRYVKEIYDPYQLTGDTEVTLGQIAIHQEIKWQQKMIELLTEGAELMESLENKNEALELLINLGKFIRACVKTALNVKKFKVETLRLQLATELSEIHKQLDILEKIVDDERENVMETIPLVQRDSRLGWEPSMEYLADEEHLNWKLRQLDRVKNVEIEEYRQRAK